MPSPSWLKQILAPAKAEASVSVPETAPAETGIPEDVLDEIRELAAQEAAALQTVPEEREGEVSEEETPEEEPLEEDVEAEAAEEPEQPQEPPKPKRPLAKAEALVDAKALKEYFAQVGVMSDEARVVMTRDGWRTKAVDPAHVAMVDVVLPAERFEALKMEWLAPPVDETAPVETPATPEPEEVVFGIDVDKVAEALRRAKGPVWFRIVDDWDRPRAEVLFGAEKRTMSLVDTDGMADPRVPALNLPASFAVPGDVLMEAVKSCASISDHIRLTIEADGTGLGAPVFTVLAQGDIDTWSASYQDEVEWVKRTADKHTSLFPLDYLTNVLKTVKQNRLTISLGTDYPIRLDWEGVTKGTVLVAPRIESA